MRQVAVAIVGTGWCGGIRAETCAAHALTKSLHIAEIRPERPAVEAPRAPAHAVQRVVVGVEDDRANVIADPQHLRRLHRPGIDAVDDRSAVRPVLCDCDPDIRAVVIESARVVDGAFAQLEVGETAPGCIHLEEMSGPLPGIAIEDLD